MGVLREIETALASALSGDAALGALVEARIYNEFAPDNAARPYALMRARGGDYERYVGGADSLRYVIQGVSDDAATALDIADALRAAIDGLTLAAGGASYRCVFRDVVKEAQLVERTQLYLAGGAYHVGRIDAPPQEPVLPEGAVAPGGGLYLEFAGERLDGDFVGFDAGFAEDVVEVTAVGDALRVFSPTVDRVQPVVELAFIPGDTALWSALRRGQEGALIWGFEGDAAGKPKWGIAARVTGRNAKARWNQPLVFVVSFANVGGEWLFNGDDGAVF